jgi:flagellar basal-body rod protein FlgF
MTTNELANVATPGFKRSFESAMLTLKVQGAGFESRLQPQYYASDNINMKPGVIIKTGRDLDVAMDGQTVMGVTAPNGELAFTRRGDLKLNGSGVLEMGTGALVRGQNGGGPITIPPGYFVKISKDGSVYATNPAQAGVAAPVLIDRILMRDASEVSLERREDLQSGWQSSRRRHSFDWQIGHSDARNIRRIQRERHGSHGETHGSKPLI